MAILSILVTSHLRSRLSSTLRTGQQDAFVVLVCMEYVVPLGEVFV